MSTEDGEVIQGLAMTVTGVKPQSSRREEYKDNNLGWACDPLLQLKTYRIPIKLQPTGKSRLILQFYFVTTATGIP